MKKIEEQLQKELKNINNKEKKFPKGELRCAKNKSRYKWFVKKQTGTSYLSKTQRDLAEKLAYKENSNGSSELITEIKINLK